MQSHSSYNTTFLDLFESDNSCYHYLVYLKWADGYNCKKCSSTKYGRGKKWHSRRCLKCRYDESATANTLFHKLKFPISEAFHIILQLLQIPQGLSTNGLSRQYSICQKTAWFFKRKIQQGMARIETEAFVESISSKMERLPSIDLKAIMLDEQGFGCVTCADVTKISCGELRSKQLHYIKLKSLRTLGSGSETEQMIQSKKEQHSKARGDQWIENLTVRKDFVVIHNSHFKIELAQWVKKTHHHISKKHLFYYCCEHIYRHRRKKIIKNDGLFSLMQVMVKHPWLSFKRISAT